MPVEPLTEPTTEQLRREALPLAGRTALVTGVSRRNGIGYAIARRLAALGARLFLHHYSPHDREQPWGEGAGGIQAVIDGVGEAVAGDLELDLTAGDAPERLVSTAAGVAGPLDILVCNQARSGGDGPLGTLTAAMLDDHYAVNSRSSILLAQAFAAQHDGRPGGRIIFMTSGQNLGPMTGEVAYAASKGALAAITWTLSDALADRGITLNTVNPGPVDTGYASGAAHEEVRRRFPAQHWGAPDDPARLIAWLTTDEAAWITGQVINSEGGFRR
ncbi:MAG TPA: SDR family oxidoreductase [Streptosporangiaceae bacterium]|jgi:3-oxoacyl-[acyl-carrier protein] reductase|nr:SDR family oxidoreductase [Streptosporangiaceae bacterium]